MTPIYNNERRAMICHVAKAQKDNKVAKKGESYYWVKKTSFAPKEYFKSLEELDEHYPKYVTISSKDLNRVLKEFKKQLKDNPKLKEKDFIDKVIFIN
jgi:hypothetical protein